MRRYVMIGSGVASIAAIEAIRSVDPRGEITLIGDESHGYYSRPGLAYYLNGEINERQLFPMDQANYHKLNIRRLHARVERIYPEQHLVRLHNGATMPYDRLLIAVGAEANMMNIPGVDLHGVVKLDKLDDARWIIKLARKARTAVVVGGGITALEIVEGLVKHGVRTHYFLRGDRYWSNVLDKTESQIVENRLRGTGVHIHYHTELREILGKNGRVVGVRTQDNQTMRCDILAIAIGIRPRKELAEISGLCVDRGVEVSETLQSSAPDVFAAGDVAQVYDPFTGKSVVDSLWGPARDQGHTAGLNMAGITTPYYKLIAFNVTRLADLTTTIVGTVGRGDDQDVIGIVRGDSETWRQLPDAIAVQSHFEINRLRLQIGKNNLLGAIIMGDQTLSRPLHQLITEQADITPIRQQLLQPGAPLVDILADFWCHWKARYAFATQ
ncbi:MAG TPA: FAD-dependent oxidoreductase [Anaerolineales bacterium]